MISSARALFKGCKLNKIKDIPIGQLCASWEKSGLDVMSKEGGKSSGEKGIFKNCVVFYSSSLCVGRMPVFLPYCTEQRHGRTAENNEIARFHQGMDRRAAKICQLCLNTQVGQEKQCVTGVQRWREKDKAQRRRGCQFVSLRWQCMRQAVNLSCVSSSQRVKRSRDWRLS